MKIRTSLLLFILFFSVELCASEVDSYVKRIEFDGKRVRQTTTIRLTIDSKDDAWMSEIEIPFKASSPAKIIYAYVLNTKGEIVRKLNKKEILERSDYDDFAFYEDEYVLEFDLSWNNYPYQIEYEYTSEYGQFVHLAHWIPLLYHSIPTRQARLEVIVPEDIELDIYYSDAISHSSSTNKAMVYHQWSINDVGAESNEHMAPPAFERVPKVIVNAKEFVYGEGGSSDSWASYGNWINKLNSSLDELPQPDQFKVTQLTKGITDQRDIIKTLYEYMQNSVRYIYVGIDIGGLKPFPASFVSENKYGDCKALTIYMKALLKFAGIKSYYTVIYAGENPVRVNSEQPGQQFNHVILAVPLGQDTVWLENTSSSLPYNYLGTFTQGRKALLIDGVNSRLIRTPNMTLNDVAEKWDYTFNLDEERNGTLTIKGTVKGDWFEEMVNLQKNGDKKKINRRILNKLNLSHAETRSITINQLHEDSAKIQVNVDLLVKNYGRNLAGLDLLELPPFQYNTPEDPQERRAPLRVAYPVNQEQTISYKLKRGYTFEIPEDIHLKSNFGDFELVFKQQGNQLTVQRNFTLYTGDYSVEEYSNYYSWISKVLHANNNLFFQLRKS